MRRTALSLAIAGLTATSQAQEIPRPMETLVVTGLKREQTLEETPVSVRVITGEAIARQPISDLYDVVERTPNVSASFGEQGFAIRGVDQRGIGGSGLGQTLTVYVDDAPLGNFTTFFGPLGAWDLGQVEVYRGPQSTNFGRNALAGAIYVRTQDPSYQPELKLRAEAGNYGHYHVAAAGGGALLEDVLAVRLSAEQRESDGYIDNTFLDTDADAKEYSAGRLKLLWDASDRVQVLSTTSYTENFAGEDGLTASNAFDREVDDNLAGKEGTETFLQSVKVNWTINDWLSLTSVTAYQSTDYIRVEDFDSTSAAIGSLDRTGEDEALSQELRLAWSLPRLELVTGLYALNTEFQFDSDIVVPITFVNPLLPLSNTVTRNSLLERDVDNYAFFMDGAYQLTPDWQLLFGLRYDQEEQAQTDVSQNTVSGTLPPPYDMLLAPELVPVSQSISADYDALLPKLGVSWDAAANAQLAFVVQQAYRAGGAEFSTLDGTVIPYDPEYLWNYELSARTDWLDGRLRWDSNLYYADWTDQQVSVPLNDSTPNLLKTVNAGESTLYGLESQLSWVIDGHWELFAALGLSHTEFDDFVNTNPQPGEPSNFAGNQFPLAPKWSGTVGVDYQNDQGLFGGINLNYQGEVYADEANAPQNKIDSRVLINLQGGYAFNEQYRVSVYVRNATDEDYYTSLNRDSDFARVGAPRQIGARLDVRL